MRYGDFVIKVLVGKIKTYIHGGARNEGGFTLIELTVALVIMAILFTILIPPMIGYRETVLERERQANIAAINDAIRQSYALEGRFPPVVGETGLDYLRDNYMVILKPHLYDYSYTIVNGRPVLTVEARGARDGG